MDGLSKRVCHRSAQSHASVELSAGALSSHAAESCTHASEWMPALLLILLCALGLSGAGGGSEWVDVFMTTDADHSESVRCYTSCCRVASSATAPAGLFTSTSGAPICPCSQRDGMGAWRQHGSMLLPMD